MLQYETTTAAADLRPLPLLKGPATVKLRRLTNLQGPRKAQWKKCQGAGNSKLHKVDADHAEYAKDLLELRFHNTRGFEKNTHQVPCTNVGTRLQQVLHNCQVPVVCSTDQSSLLHLAAEA